jgi:hypothetical protein
VALGIYFAPTGMTQAQYSDCIARLNKAGAAHPAGRRYHAMFGDGGNLHVFDVWESQAQFDKFGETLLPILQSIGIDPGQPMVAQIHNVIVPPAKAAAKKAKAKPARKAAPKRKAAKATKKKRK